ncbi:MAG: hypothetical protein IJ496_09515 [Ruminococcus sp.]|nr:hypothetical protein [Ruminococcus sp.]
MPQEFIYYLFTTAVTVVIGIIGYFLKRTMSRSDQNEAAIRELRDDLLTLSDRYATKNDDFVRTMTRLETKIDKLKG